MVITSSWDPRLDNFIGPLELNFRARFASQAVDQLTSCMGFTLVAFVMHASTSEVRASAGNLFTNCNTGGGFADLSNSSVVYSHNNVSVIGPVTWAGFLAFQGVYTSIEMPTSYLIDHNRFKASGSFQEGIWILDFVSAFEGRKTTNAVISNNTITIEPSEYGPAFAGIETTFTEGTVIFK